MISGVNSQISGFVNQVLSNGSEQNKIQQTSEVVAKDRVSILSEQIKNGEYKVDTPKTSQYVAEELLAN